MSNKEYREFYKKQSESDKLLLRWWNEKKPIDWSFEFHIIDPYVNVFGSDRKLARYVVHKILRVGYEFL